jgi:UDP-sugar transporter A1/2/3
MDLASFLLALLTLHRTGTSIALHEAKSRTHFSTALAVLLGEVLKQIISFTIAAYTTVSKEEHYQLLPNSSSPELEKDASLPPSRRGITARCVRQKQGWQALMAKIFDRRAFLLLLPAAIYVGQNNLFLYAAGKLQPSLFQAVWQLRLIPTAYFSQLILKKKIGAYRWLSLLGLVIGVIVIQSSFAAPASLDSSSRFSKESFVLLTPVLALLFSAVLAALAGVTLESIFVQKETDIWIANLHLSTFSLLPCIFLLSIEAHNTPGGLSSIVADFNSSYWPWVAVVINGTSGCLVALVTKHAGCIANNISGIASIATTHMLEMTFSSSAIKSTTFMQQLEFYLGLAVIVTSTYYYLTLAVPVKIENEETGVSFIPSHTRTPSSSCSSLSDQYDDDAHYEVKEKALGVSLHSTSA